MGKFVEAGEKGEGPKYGITLVKPSGEQLQVGGTEPADPQCPQLVCKPGLAAGCCERGAGALYNYFIIFIEYFPVLFCLYGRRGLYNGPLMCLHRVPVAVVPGAIVQRSLLWATTRAAQRTAAAGEWMRAELFCLIVGWLPWLPIWAAAPSVHAALSADHESPRPEGSSQLAAAVTAGSSAHSHCHMPCCCPRRPSRT